MNKWRIIVIGLIALALAFTITAAVFNWNNYPSEQQLSRFEKLFGSPGQHSPDLEQASTGVSMIMRLISIYLSCVFVLYAIPGRIRRISQNLPTRPLGWFQLILLGLLVSLISLGVMLSSLISLGTVPIILLVMILQFIGTLTGLTALMYKTGKFLMERANWGHSSPLIKLLAGTILFLPWTFLPYVGWIFFVSFFSLGLGIALKTRFGSPQAWNLNPLYEEGN